MSLSTFVTAKPPSTQPSQKVLAQAADWFALLHSGDANTADHQNWQAWLDKNSEHQQAWQFVQAVEQSFAIASTDNPKSTEQVLLQRHNARISRRTVLRAFAAICTTTGLGLASWQYSALPRLVNQWRAQYYSEIGEIKPVQLSDGTHVWLNTASAFTTDFNAKQKVITLLQGEILITTAKGDTRPLLIKTKQGQVRPIGTQFTVHQQEQKTQVDVFEGAVEITPRNTQPHVINAGKQLIFTEKNRGNIQAADSAKAAWSQGVLLAEDISLQDIVKQLTRYQHGYINLANDIAHLSVYGSFPLHSPKQILTMLEQVLPIKVTYLLPWWINIEASPK